MKIRYRKSLLGMLWTILIPAGSAIIYYIVLKNVMRVQQQNHFILILASQIGWAFFASAISSGLEQIVSNFSLFNKVPMPPQSIVLADTLTLVLNLILSLPVLLLAMALLHVVPTLAFLQYFSLLALLALLTYGLSLLLSLMYVYFRDLKPLMALILQFWFYLTPVLYTEDMVPEKYRWLLSLNPIGQIFVGLQKAVKGEFLSVDGWACALAWSFGLFLVSLITLKRVRNDVVEIA
jgi:lipopolysaccharide transport system permease protein